MVQNMEPIESEIPGVIRISIYSATISIVIKLDERFNTIHVPKKVLSTEESNAVRYIRSMFNKLKFSDPSYGNMNGDSEIEYEPVKYIFTRDFFSFLKEENREYIIDNILETKKKK